MSLDRRTFLASTLAALAVGPALAKAPLAGKQAPGLYRLKVGSIEITALNDGWFPIPPKVFPDAAGPEVERLLERAFLQPDVIPTSVNGYLVNKGDRLLLIDAGSGDRIGPTVGRLSDNLAAAGVDPAAVDAVLLTHLHPDHAGGLLGEGGAAFFPNAEIILSEPEHAFWMDDGNLSRAAADAKQNFELARSYLKPYAGRIRRIPAQGEVEAGIVAIAGPGHTPGHTLYRISSENSDLLVWGDIVHVAAFQFQRPDWLLSYDVDPDQARKTRSKIFEMAAADRTRVAGMHLNFPGLGHVAREGKAYRFAPAFWSPDL